VTDLTGGGWISNYRRRRDEKRERKRDRRSPGHTARSISAPENERPLCPLDLSDDLVTVSVPVFRTPVLLMERAVRSILNGSHKHVRVVMISDGEGRRDWSDLSSELRDDKRLLRIISPSNLGPYFNHDVVLRASRAPFFAVQDSDDVSHRDRLKRQLALLHDTRSEAVHSPIYQCNLHGRRNLVRCTHRPGEGWAHRADHFGTYCKASLMEFGGYHAGFRVGYDTNITSFLNLLVRTAVTPAALYTRHERPGSLTLGAATGYRSAMREAIKRDLRAMWGSVYRSFGQSRRAATNQLRTLSLSRAAAHGDIGLRDRLVAELREALDAVVLRPAPMSEPLLRRILAACHPDKEEQAFVRLVYRRCEEVAPPRVTAIATPAVTAIALYGSRYGVDVRCMHPDPDMCKEMRRRLSSIGLPPTMIEQSSEFGADPGLIVVGDSNTWGALDLLRSGTELWMPPNQDEAETSKRQWRRLPENDGVIRWEAGSR
jgi:glycosyltransferase involved in cell wall biosynthesis